MSQLSYEVNMKEARAGLAAEKESSNDVKTHLNSTDPLFFGRMVVQGATADEVKHPDAAGAEQIGVVQMTLGLESNDDGLEANYPAKVPANIRTARRIWVVIEEDIALGDAVFYRHTAAAAPLDRLGAFRTDVGGGNAEELTNARWVKPALAADGIALLELRKL